MPKVKLSDFTLVYELRGAGLPLLFIHGYPLNRSLWEPQLTGLSDKVRIITPDLRGHGDSEAGSAAHSMHQLAQDCFELITLLGITQPFVVCGLSMGGYIAMAMLRIHPQRIAGLILTATRSTADTPEVKASRDKSIQLAQQEGPGPIIEAMLPRLLSPKTPASRPELTSQAKHIMASISVSTIVKDLQGLKERPDSTPLLAALTQPTLIIHGADDQIVPLAEAQALQKTIPGAQLVVLPAAGHLPNLEQPSLFNDAVRQFLKSIPNEQK